MEILSRLVNPRPAAQMVEWQGMVEHFGLFLAGKRQKYSHA
jgi:hypothetical protein